MKQRNDPRHLSRVLAMQKLFSIHFVGDTATPVTEVKPSDIDQLAADSDFHNYNTDLAVTITNGVVKDETQLDDIIKTYAPQWPIDQIQKVDIEALRIALWEWFVAKITPPKVAIDEAIEIAKEYGGEASGKFVNGVLGAIYEKTNPKDKEQDSKEEKDGQDK